MNLVTGGTGFLGAHLLYHLTNKGEAVKALKRPHSSTALTEKIFSFYTENPEQLLQKITWVEGDVLDIQSLIDHSADVDFVYHTAAVVSFDSRDREKMLETNINGTANVVNAALETGIKKLCHVSSIAALGRTGNNGVTDEESPWAGAKGVSNYALSKYEAEREVWRGIAEGLDAVIVNPSVILGPGNWNAGSSKLFTTVYKGLKVYTLGTNGYIDVNDVAQAMIWLMNSHVTGERFVLNSENVAYKQLFEWMAAALHVSAPTLKAGALLSELAWRSLKLVSFFTRKPPFITKETARTANRIHRYSADKFKLLSRLKVTSVNQSIRQTGVLFLKDHNDTHSA